jgi:hypothetical protein
MIMFVEESKSKSMGWNHLDECWSGLLSCLVLTRPWIGIGIGIQVLADAMLATNLPTLPYTEHICGCF